MAEEYDYSEIEKGIVPHIAGYSADGKANGTTDAVQTVARTLGLPLTTWRASDIPAPAQALEWTLDAAGKSLQEVLTEAILHTYDVSQDSNALRGALDQFEKLRGDYPVRREFTAFTVLLQNGSEEAARRLEALGFTVKVI